MQDHNFENLEVWKRASRLAVEVHVATAQSKAFALKDQVQRSALSIPSNIAEGAERPTRADFLRFLGYAKGSCGELRTQLMIHLAVSKDLGVEPYAGTKDFIEESRELARMLKGLIQRIESDKTKGNHYTQ